jgi:hypothetical protein
MLDYGASINLMSLTVMNQLGLKATKPYINVYAIDSREVKFCDLIKNLSVSFIVYQDMPLLMDVVFIVVLDAWGILLTSKCTTDFGGSIQMDLPYVTITNYENTFINLHFELWGK